MGEVMADAGASEVPAVVPLDRLWISKDWWNVMAQGYGARFEAVGPRGYHRMVSSGFLSFWAMRWWLRKQERIAVREFSEWPDHVDRVRRALQAEAQEEPEPKAKANNPNQGGPA